MTSKESMSLTFCGAAETVTGSKYLVRCGDRQLLVDCGMFQGKKELRLRNWAPPPFEPLKLSAVVLTHAHIDHTGYLPVLARYGFRGPIFGSAATVALTKILLRDSASLQEEEATFAARHGTSKHNPPLPLYDIKDAERAIELLRPFSGSDPCEVLPGIEIRRYNAGHILGSLMLNLDFQGRRITFSGDVGRYDVPLLSDPSPVDIGDLLLCESTYGDRSHGTANMQEELCEVIAKVIDRKGPLIIPAFALGRTQTLLYFLAELERAGRIPELPVFVDSPMADAVTDLYRTQYAEFDDATRALIDAKGRPLATVRTKFVKSVEESKALNNLKGPRIIIAASGMVTGGRVLHHLKHHLPKEETTVLFVGYQGEGTRGALIQAGAGEVKIFGQYIPIRARVETISGLSAHGDASELLRWLESSKGTPKITRIVHGEISAARTFSEAVTAKFKWNAHPAKHLEEVTIS